jgi:two-component system, OmpR family, response regulator MprA
MTRVLIVEDDRGIADVVSVGLAQEGFDVRVATTGPRALEALRDEPPDLVVLDLGLPGLSGHEVLAHVRRLGSLPVVILSARSELSDRVAGLEAGADDYLVKPFRFEELLARIRAVLRRSAPDGADATTVVGDLVLDRDARQVTRAGRSVELTTREFDLLELLISNAGKVLTREVLFDRVWNYDFLGESSVIETHVSNLRRKLEAHGPRLVHTVRGVGYVLRA